MIEIPLKLDYVALVSDEDEDLASLKWFYTVGGYVERRFRITGGWEKQKIHRLIMERVLGYAIPKGYEVDHINRSKLDNCRDNLRLARRVDNRRNSSRQSNNTSGFKGVCRSCGTRWRARINTDGGRLDLGSFATSEDAARAYNEAALKYFGEFAALNVIDDEAQS